MANWTYTIIIESSNQELDTHVMSGLRKTRMLTLLRIVTECNLPEHNESSLIGSADEMSYMLNSKRYRNTREFEFIGSQSYRVCVSRTR